jgi:hypothetical protein
LPVSRHHHGGRPHRPSGHARPIPYPRASTEAGAVGQNGYAGPTPGAHVDANVVETEPRIERPGPDQAAPLEVSREVESPIVHEPGPRPAEPAPADRNGSADAGASCTAPQLRRFIKSRPYVPMHELRRRFGINGSEDEVTLVDLGGGRVFVGLPPREGALLGELLRGGEIGYELSLDPRSPVVVGLYPMRPVART